VTRPVAALTGASGFLGRALADHLHRNGWRVRVLVRRPLDTALWDGPPPEEVRGDLADEAALKALVEGSGVVIHAAGLVKAMSRAEFFAANAEGAAAIARAVAAHAPASRLVLVSSLSAREPQISDYAASKRAGEAAVQAVLTPARLAIVRPPAIYGPGDRATLDIFRLATRSPFLPILGTADARLAMVHVEDAAAEIVRVGIEGSNPLISAIGGARPEGYGWPEIRDAFGLATGRRLRLFALPPQILLLAGQAGALSARLGGAPQVMSPGKAREMLHADWSVSPAEMAAGARPARIGLSDGLADTLKWYRGHGWL
jgi:nucleoside-diphosphate-sugar epimerase